VSIIDKNEKKLVGNDFNYFKKGGVGEKTKDV